jgi:hypothetical protein
VEVHTFEADLLVWDKIILELKVLPRSGFASAHIAQIIHYLKCWKMDLGFLVNYGENVRSIIDNPPSYDFIRMKTFLKSLGLRFGLIINFSKRQLQIYGVNPL